MSDRKHRIARHWTARIVSVIAGGLLGAIFICAAFPAAADEDVLDLDGAQPLPNGSLLSMRGGFSIGGFDISFGVTVRATVNGATELATSFNVLNSGQIGNPSVSLSQDGNVVYSNGNSTTTAGVNGTSIPLSNARVDNQSGQGTTQSNGSVLATANGFNLVKLDSGGYALTSMDTSIIQNVTNNSVVSEVANTANNQQIQTSLTADLFINNFSDMAGRSDMNRLMTHLMAEQMRAGMLGP